MIFKIAKFCYQPKVSLFIWMLLFFFIQILNAKAEESIEDKFNSITPEQREVFKVPSELNAVVVAGNPGTLAVSSSGPPLDVRLFFPQSNAFDSSGTLYNTSGTLQLKDGTVSPFSTNFLDCPAVGHVIDRADNHYIFDFCELPLLKKITPEGESTVVAGITTSDEPRCQDIPCPATEVAIGLMSNLTIDSSNDDVYFVEPRNSDGFDGKVWKLSGGFIEAVVSGLPRNDARSVAVDPATKDIFVGLLGEIRRYDRSDESEDNFGVVTTAILDPVSLLVDPETGDLYVADGKGAKIKMISPPEPGGTVTDLVGTGVAGYNGDGPALSTQINFPTGLSLKGRDLYWSEERNHIVRKTSLDLPNGAAVTVMGIGVDLRRPATEVTLTQPTDVACDARNNCYIADRASHLVYKLNREGFLSVFAGGGTDLQDGVPATQAFFESPSSLALGPDGSLYIGDEDTDLVRKVDPDGNIHTVAGVAYNQCGGCCDNSGAIFPCGDGGPATDALIDYPSGLFVDEKGVLYIADQGISRVRTVGRDGIIRPFAGSGYFDCIGDGGPATEACLPELHTVVGDRAGRILIADSNNHRIRVVENGIIITLSGTGVPTGSIDGPGGDPDDDLGDGGPASAASYGRPKDLAMDGEGNLYIADPFNGVRKIIAGANGLIDPSDLIIQVTKSGGFGFEGDGGRALDTTIDFPHGLAVDEEQNLFVADISNTIVWRINLDADVLQTSPANLSLSLTEDLFGTLLDVVGLESQDIGKRSLTIQAINPATNRHGPKIPIDSIMKYPPDPLMPDLLANFGMSGVLSSVNEAISTAPGSSPIKLRVEGRTKNKNILERSTFTGDILIPVESLERNGSK